VQVKDHQKERKKIGEKKKNQPWKKGYAGDIPSERRENSRNEK